MMTAKMTAQMTAKIRSIPAAFLLLLMACSPLRTAEAAPPADEKAVAEPVPEMIGEGVLSTPDDEFGGALSPDGKTISYAITAPAHYPSVLCESRFVDRQWQRPEVLP